MRGGSGGSPELIALAGALLLAVGLFLPWYETDPANRNATVAGTRGSVSAWQAESVLRWLLLAVALAPFVLAWIMLRDHELSWPRGELTAVVAMVGFVLVLYVGAIAPSGPAGRRHLPGHRLVSGPARLHPRVRRRRRARRLDRTTAKAPGGPLTWPTSRPIATSPSSSSASPRRPPCRPRGCSGWATRRPPTRPRSTACTPCSKPCTWTASWSSARGRRTRRRCWPTASRSATAPRLRSASPSTPWRARGCTRAAPRARWR